MATQHVGTDYSKSLTSVLDSAEHIWFLFFSSECLVEIGSLRGWNCFWPFLWSWVSPLRFAKWTGSIRGHRGARRRVLLKGDGRKTTWRLPPCLPPFSFSTTGLLQRDGDTYRPCMEAPRVGLQSPTKTSRPMARGQNVHGGLGDWHEHPPPTAGEWFPTRNLEFVTQNFKQSPEKYNFPWFPG